MQQREVAFQLAGRSHCTVLHQYYTIAPDCIPKYAIGPCTPEQQIEVFSHG